MYLTKNVCRAFNKLLLLYIGFCHECNKWYKPFNPIDVADSYDLNEDDEKQREWSSIVIEYSEPVASRGGCEAQANQKAEHTNQA